MAWGRAPALGHHSALGGSSTPAQLEAAAALWREHPELNLQTHIAEYREEVAFVTKLFPERKDFLDNYDH